MKTLSTAKQRFSAASLALVTGIAIYIPVPTPNAAPVVQPAHRVSSGVFASEEIYSEAKVIHLAAVRNEAKINSDAQAGRAAADAATALRAAKDSNSYVVQSPDEISKIAATFGLDAEAFSAANGLYQNSTIYVGQTLRLTGPNIRTATKTVAQEPAARENMTQGAPAKAPGAPALVSTGRIIYVVGAGGQAAIDACNGPVHFTPITRSYVVAEHDSCGGWSRFSGIQVGETVTIAGVGTYTVSGRGIVPQNGGTGNDVIAALGHIPKAFLQTCVLGSTTQTLIVGLD